MARPRKRPHKTKKRRKIWKIIPIHKLEKVKTIKYKDVFGKIHNVKPNVILVKYDHRSHTGGSGPNTGTSGEYPFTNKVVKGILGYIAEKDPTRLSEFVEKAKEVVEWPLKLADNNVIIGPFVNIAITGAHGFIETAVSGITGVGETVGGPVGEAAVLPFTLAGAAAGSLLAVAEGDYGQSTIHILNVIPGVGAALVKGLGKVEHFVRKVNKTRKKIEAIPIIGQRISNYIPRLNTNDQEAYKGDQGHQGQEAYKGDQGHQGQEAYKGDQGR